MRHKKSAGDIMGLNRFIVNGAGIHTYPPSFLSYVNLTHIFFAATALRFLLALPFIFASVSNSFLIISGALVVFAVIMVICSWLLHNLPISNEDNSKKTKEKKNKALTKEALGSGSVPLISVKNNTGCLIVFEGTPPLALFCYLTFLFDWPFAVVN